MKIFSFLAVIAVVAADKVLDESIYKPDSIIYNAKHDIVGIHAPVYLTHSKDDIIFTVEENNGLYSLKQNTDVTEKDTVTVTKILENGKCITSDKDGVFFGASDGIYTYNFKEKTAEKYGNITADVKAIQKDPNQDIIYVIVDDNLRKVTNKGTKMAKVEGVGNVQEIVLDSSMNVYLYEKDQSTKLLGLVKRDTYKPKVIVDNKVVDIKDLPEFNSIKLARVVASAEGAILIIDNRMYRVFANGTSVSTEFVFEKVPTACFMDLGIIQLFSNGRDLFQFNVLEPLLLGLKSAVGDFFSSLVR